MTKHSSFKKLVSAALLGCGALAAQASMVGSVTYGSDSLSAAEATGYYGVLKGNDSKGINALPVNWGGGWTLAAKDNTGSSDDESKTVNGVTFSVDAGAAKPMGSWLLSASGLDSSLNLDMVVVLKSSTKYALYYFQNVDFAGLAGGEWLSPAVNKRGITQALSHLSVYVRQGSDGGFASPMGEMFMPTSMTVADAGEVPEPGSLALAGLGLLGALGVTRRAQRRRGA